jgi:uncharacterized protein (DUF983 family)
MPSPILMLWRGLTKRCPWCGQGKLFRRWLSLKGRCPRCNLRFEREEGAFLGAMALNYGVTGVAFIVLLVGWLIVELPEVKLIPLLAASIAVMVVVPILFFPFSKTIWVAIDLLLHLDSKDPTSVARTFGVGEIRARPPGPQT